MEKNVPVLTCRPRNTSFLELSGDVEQGMILDRWEFQEILKEIASRTKAQEKSLAGA